MTYDELLLRNYHLEQENLQLREMVKLLKVRLDEFLVWFQGTIDGVH